MDNEKIKALAVSERAYYERQATYDAAVAVWQAWKDSSILGMQDAGLWELYIKQLHGVKLSKLERSRLPALEECVKKIKAAEPVYPNNPNLLVFPLSPYDVRDKTLTLAEAVEVYQQASIAKPAWLVDMREGERRLAALVNPTEEDYVNVVLLQHGAAHVDSKTRSTIALNALRSYRQMYEKKGGA